jgi:hypothetical protein
MLLSQRNLKTYISLKVAVFTRNRTNKQLWQKKSRFRFDCKKIQHFVSITNIQQSVEFSAKWSTKWPFSLKNCEGTPNWLILFLRKHHSGVVSNLEHIPQTQQNENKIAYDHKTSEKLKRATNKFSNEQNHKEKLQQNNFSIHSHLSTFFKCEFFLLLRWQK